MHIWTKIHLKTLSLQKESAHGYFIMSKAAGLFVKPEKGPVLLNYGIDECRFTKTCIPRNDNWSKIYSKRKK